MQCMVGFSGNLQKWNTEVKIFSSVCFSSTRSLSLFAVGGATSPDIQVAVVASAKSDCYWKQFIFVFFLSYDVSDVVTLNTKSTAFWWRITCQWVSWGHPQEMFTSSLLGRRWISQDPWVTTLPSFRVFLLRRLHLLFAVRVIKVRDQFLDSCVEQSLIGLAQFLFVRCIPKSANN